MFSGAEVFNQDLSMWDVSSAEKFVSAPYLEMAVHGAFAFWFFSRANKSTGVSTALAL